MPNHGTKLSGMIGVSLAAAGAYWFGLYGFFGGVAVFVIVTAVLMARRDRAEERRRIRTMFATSQYPKDLVGHEVVDHDRHGSDHREPKQGA